MVHILTRPLATSYYYCKANTANTTYVTIVDDTNRYELRTICAALERLICIACYLMCPYYQHFKIHITNCTLCDRHKAYFIPPPDTQYARPYMHVATQRPSFQLADNKLRKSLLDISRGRNPFGKCGRVGRRDFSVTSASSRVDDSWCSRRLFLLSAAKKLRKKVKAEISADNQHGHLVILRKNFSDRSIYSSAWWRLRMSTHTPFGASGHDSAH